MKPRPEVVEQLVQAMRTGIKHGVIGNFSIDELASAVFTLTQRTCGAVLELSTNPEHTRGELTRGLSEILFEVMPQRKAS